MTGLERMITKVCNALDVAQRRQAAAVHIEQVTEGELIYLSRQEAIDEAERDFERLRRSGRPAPHFGCE